MDYNDLDSCHKSGSLQAMQRGIRDIYCSSAFPTLFNTEDRKHDSASISNLDKRLFSMSNLWFAYFSIFEQEHHYTDCEDVHASDGLSERQG